MCSERTSGVLQGWYVSLTPDIARPLSVTDADVNWFEAGQLLLSASIGGYIVVWSVCGVTALIAAVGLAAVPRLAFADLEPLQDATPTITR